MLDSFILIISALLGAMSCLFYFYFNRRSMQLWRGNVQAELEAAQEELMEDLRRIDISQLQRTRAGQELFQILQQDRLLPLAQSAPSARPNPESSRNTSRETVYHHNQS